MRCLALLLAAGLLVTGCADDPVPDPTRTPVPTDTAAPTEGTATPGTPTSPTSGTAPPFPANTRPDTNEGSGDPVTLTDVRVGQHDGYERVALDLGGGGIAGWDAAYEDDPRHQGSGHAVEIAGDAVLVVDLTNIGVPDDTGAATYEGPERLPVGDTIVEVVVGSTFEGRTEVFLGVTGEQPFRVQWIDGSVVVDVVAP